MGLVGGLDQLVHQIRRGKSRKNDLRILPFDRVLVESAVDLTRGRILYRHLYRHLYR